jgi:hypothetical protein
VFSRSIAINNVPTALAPTASGGVIVGGTLIPDESVDLGGGSLDAQAGGAIWLAELDAAGAHLWSRAFPQALAPFVVTGSLGPAGNLTLLGTLNGALDFGPSALGGPPGVNFVARVDASGEPVWVRPLDDTGAAQATDLVVDAVGHTFVTGSVQAPVDLGGGILDATGASMEFLLELDEAGEHVRSELVACNAAGRFASRSGTTSGFVLAGGFSIAAAFGAGALQSKGPAAFAARFDPDR